MTIIPRAEWEKIVNLLVFRTLDGREFEAIPNLLCRKCWSLVSITIMHTPEQIEITDCKCKKK